MKINLLLIFLLYIMRLGLAIAYLAGLQFLWITPLYDISNYFLSALFIWLNREDLKKFNIDTLALVIFLVFRSILWVSINTP